MNSEGVASVNEKTRHDMRVEELVKEIDQEWLASVGQAISTQPMIWTDRQAPGIDLVSNSARKQALLPKPWAFYGVGTDGEVSVPDAVQLPHRFKANRAYKSGWYVTKCQIDRQSNKRYVLLLDRVQMFGMVYVNGKLCGRHFGGYTPFEIDMTDAVVQGENVLAILVHDQSISVDGDKVYNQIGVARLKSIYNPNAEMRDLPGGIDCIPTIEIRDAVYIKDVVVRTSTRKNELEIEVELASDVAPLADLTCSFALYDWPDGNPVDLGIPDLSVDGSDAITACNIKWRNPKLWSPDHPHLYVLRTTLNTGDGTDVLDVRFGFREFWIEGKSFVLNGVPIRLRGESYYFPALSGRDFHREVFKKHKALFGANACRLHAFMPPGDVVLGADEAGILLIDQSAIWSENASYYKNGGELFLKNTEREFEEWARRDRNSPSVVIWDVENEMLRVSYEDHLPWVKELPAYIEKFDETRPFNNSAQGWFSPDQDMVLLHMQEHYSRIMADWDAKDDKPLIMGEFWIGGRMEQRLPNSPEFLSADQRYVEEAKVYEEQMLEMRYRGVSGVMPFRISQLVFPRVRDPEVYAFSPPDRLDIGTRSDEVIQRIRHGLQPVSIFFWPRQTYVASGQTIQREIVICNDGEDAKELDVTWGWDDQADECETISLGPAEQRRIAIDQIPPTDAKQITATVSCDNTVLSRDTLLTHQIDVPELNVQKPLLVYDDDPLADQLTGMGLKTTSNAAVPEAKDDVLWIIPEHANNRELNARKDDILAYLNDGGHMLCLKQDQAPTWFPVRFRFWSAYQTAPHTYAGMGWEGLNKHLFFSTETPIYAASHPVFSGLRGTTLHAWDKFDGRVSDDVFTRPSNVKQYEPGNWRPLAGGTRREHVSLVEVFCGKGLLFSCQLNLMENLDNAQARTLLVNMLNYLSGRAAVPLDHTLAVRGKLTEADVVDLTGASDEVFANAKADQQGLMLASEGTDVEEIKARASNGGTVVVLSGGLAQEFDGVTVCSEENALYLATKIADHPLLHGVASTNFMSVDLPVVKGYFSELPSGAKVLLQGFSADKNSVGAHLTSLWHVSDAGPVAVSLPCGEGEIILSTIEIENPASAATRELLGLLCTNCGVNVPYTQTTTEEILIKKTVPITVDGDLREWTEDMEDRYVTQYVHAQPVYLTSECIIEGPPEFDLNLSAIVYFLWNADALHIAGVVFGEEKTFESGVQYGRPKEYELEILYNQDVIHISYQNNQANAEVNGRCDSGIQLGTGQVDSAELTDATRLQFDYILKSGEIASVDHLAGETFELQIPWAFLKSTPTDETANGLISVASKGSKLQTPLSGNPETKDGWLVMNLEP